MKNLIIIMFTLLMSLKSFATMFQAIPLEQLIEESSSAAEVELKSKKSYKNKHGTIMTDFSFNVIEGFNLSGDDVVGNVLRITMSGGTIDGITSFIDSAPEFTEGEKSFLLFKKIESRLYLSNFSMGKYKIENVHDQIYYISTVFPFDKDLGVVKKERMVDLMKMKFKFTKASGPDSFKPADPMVKQLASVDQKKLDERKPAQERLDEKQEFYEVIWGFIALLTVSGLIIWWKLKSGVKVN